MTTQMEMIRSTISRFILQHGVAYIILSALFLTTSNLVAQDAPSSPERPGFGIGAFEVGLGIAPLGLTSENDLDVLVEFGGFISIISRNPDGIMLRFSGSYGKSQINAPAEVLSEGPFTISRFDASIMYGSYFYGGVGVGYALLNHELGADAIQQLNLRGQIGEESFDNSMYYVARFGVRSEGKFGYFVEGVISMMQPQVHASVTDLPTGQTASKTSQLDLNIFHFFHLGLAYRF